MIAIISATKQEVEIFLREIVSSEIKSIDGMEIVEGIFLNERVSLIISGVGIKKAKNAATLAATKYKPKFILTTGFSGALDKSLSVGDIVIGEQVVSLKEDKTIKLFSDLPHISFDYKKGKILSGNRFISNRKEKEELHRQTGAMSVDMETWGVASAISSYGIKTISVRTISDSLSYSLPRMGKLFNENSDISLKKSLNYFFRNPEHFPAFLRFKYINLRKAKIRLNHFLTVFISVLAGIDN